MKLGGGGCEGLSEAASRSWSLVLTLVVGLVGCRGGDDRELAYGCRLASEAKLAAFEIIELRAFAGLIDRSLLAGVAIAIEFGRDGVPSTPCRQELILSELSWGIPIPEPCDGCVIDPRRECGSLLPALVLVATLPVRLRSPSLPSFRENEEPVSQLS